MYKEGRVHGVLINYTTYIKFRKIFKVSYKWGGKSEECTRNNSIKLLTNA